MKFGICAPYQDVMTLQHLPFDYLEENVQRFLLPEQPPEVFEAHWNVARQLPVPIEAANSLLPASLPIIATPDRPIDKARLERYMKTALQRAEQVGIHVIVFGSGDARKHPSDCTYDDARQQIAEHFAQWSIWARAHGIQIALEPLRYEETNILNTVAESGKFVDELADTGATLLVDTYHMACNGEAPSDILTYATHLSHVHVAEKQERAAPGHYHEDFRPYFAALHQSRYDKRISIECRWQDLAAEVEPAIATLKKQWMV